jgi:hypothetical protein
MLDPVLVGLIERMTRLELLFQQMDQKLAATVTPLERDMTRRRNEAAEAERQAEIKKLQDRIAELEKPAHDLGAVEG